MKCINGMKNTMRREKKMATNNELRTEYFCTVIIIHAVTINPSRNKTSLSKFSILTIYYTFLFSGSVASNHIPNPSVITHLDFQMFNTNYKNV